MHASSTTLLRQAFTASYSQHNRLLRLYTPLGADAFVVLGMTGREAVNALSSLTVRCVAPSAFYPLETLVGMPASLCLQRADGEARWWHGHILRASFDGSDGGLAFYELRIEPWLAFLEHRRDSRVFRNATALDVVEQMLSPYPQATYSLDIGRDLPVRRICTQFRETDLDFLRRLLAEEGLNFRFAYAGPMRAPSSLEPAQFAARLLIYDQQAELARCLPSEIRFHRVAAPEQDDAINRFQFGHQLASTGVALTRWQPERVRGLAGQVQQPQTGDAPSLPPLEIYQVDRAGPREGGPDMLEADADRALAALRLSSACAEGAGSARQLEAGLAFDLLAHADRDGTYLTLSVTHEASNNLGPDLAARLENPALDAGSYRNRFVAVPAQTPLVPAARRKPSPGGPDSARVVGIADEVLTSDRDHQVMIRFHWEQSPEEAALQAGGPEQSGSWVRVGEVLAGPNWGSVFVPRIGSEVLVDFIDDDIDQPVITGRIFNGIDQPPLAGGQGSDANHPGVLSGIHSRPATMQGGASQAFNQWVMDDSPGQLRHRLATSQSDSGLSLGYLVDQTGSHRGRYRGEGFELASAGWTAVRAGEGFLISTTRRPEGRSAAMDPAEAVGQLLAAEELAESLSDIAQTQGADPLAANAAQRAFVQSINPEEDGHFTGEVGGQDSRKHQPGTRQPGDAAECFSQPHILLDSASSLAQTTPASSLYFAAGSTQVTTQRDTHQSAADTHSTIAGGGASLFTHSGGINITAAQGPVSLQVHDDQLEMLADDSITVSSSQDRVNVLAKKKIVLNSGQSSITLDGANITFACPGTFSVKGGTHQFTSPASRPAALDELPSGVGQLPDFGELKLTEASFIPAARADRLSIAPSRSVRDVKNEKSVINQPQTQIITLRIGVFFDGTGNNEENAIAAECGPSKPAFPAEDIPDLDQFCRDSQPSTPNAEGSYANARSNIARLYELYQDDSTRQLGKADSSASLKAYIEGIGTNAGERDDLWGQISGEGSAGVIARVEQSPAEVGNALTLLVQRNPQIKISRIEFDTFGFSRGATAARHFANEIIDGPESIMAALWKRSPELFIDGFCGLYGDQLKVRFVGLFDSVAAILDPKRLDFSVSNARNSKVRLYLPSNRIEKVVHLRAADEKREAFALNQVLPGHTEITVPGVHSDIGGGYLREGTERLLLTKPRYQSSRKAQSPQNSAVYARAEEDLTRWKRHHPDMANHDGLRVRLTVKSHSFGAARSAPGPRYRIMAAAYMERTVRGELSLIYLRIMRDMAEKAGVPFKEIEAGMLEYRLPAELEVIHYKLCARANDGIDRLSAEERRMMYQKYIHISAHWTLKLGIAIHKPTHDYLRIVHEHAQDD